MAGSSSERLALVLAGRLGRARRVRSSREASLRAAETAARRATRAGATRAERRRSSTRCSIRRRTSARPGALVDRALARYESEGKDMSESDDEDIHARGMEVRREVLGDAHVDRRDRAHDAVHRGLPGPHHALRVGRDLDAARARPPHAELHHADGARRQRTRARARAARPRGAAQRADPGGDRRGPAPVRGLLRRPRGEQRVRDRAARARRGRRRMTRAVVLSAVRTPVGPLRRRARGRASGRPRGGRRRRRGRARRCPRGRDRGRLARLREPGGRGQPQRGAVRGAPRGAARSRSRA